MVNLTWEALKPLDRDLRFYIGYLDRTLQTLHDSRFYPPTAVLWYPTTLWQPGEQVLVQTLPWTLDSDEFVLTVGVYAGEAGWETGARAPATAVAPTLPKFDGDTMVRLGGFAATDGRGWQSIAPTSGTPERALDAAFAQSLYLNGATVPATARPGEALPVTLFWSADRPPAEDDSLFVQLLDADGVNVAQWDGVPADRVSTLPASDWPAGWRGAQMAPLALPETLPTGEYTVIAGMYDWQSGVRLAVSGADVRPDNAVVLGVVHISE